jgi:hypothetical protein
MRSVCLTQHQNFRALILSILVFLNMKILHFAQNLTSDSPLFDQLKPPDCNTNTDFAGLTFIHSSMALRPFVGPWPLLQFRNLFYTDSRTPWTSDQPVARPLPTHRTTQTQNKRIHSNPCLEWDSNPRSQRSSERRQFMP